MWRWALNMENQGALKKEVEQIKLKITPFVMAFTTQDPNKLKRLHSQQFIDAELQSFLTQKQAIKALGDSMDGLVIRHQSYLLALKARANAANKASTPNTRKQKSSS